MIEIVRTTRIAATPAEVWSMLADFGAIAEWATNVDHSCLLSDQAGGEETSRRIQTGRTTLVERIQEWRPASESEQSARLAYRIEGLPPVVKSVINTWSVEAAGQGSTVSLTSRIDAGPRPPQQLVAKAIGRKLGQASDEMLAGLAFRAAAQADEPSEAKGSTP